MFANQISAGQLLMNFLSEAKGEIEENISSCCFAEELQKQQTGEGGAALATAGQGQSASTFSHGSLLGGGMVGAPDSSASVDKKGVEKPAVSSGQSTRAALSGQGNQNGLVAGLENRAADQTTAGSVKKQSASQGVASSLKARRSAARATDLYVADTSVLQGILAQLQVPAEIRQSCVSAVDEQGRVSLKRLGQVLGGTGQESGNASGKPQSAQGKVDVAGVRQLLESMLSSGGSGSSVSASPQGVERFNLKTSGSYTLPEFRELLSRVVEEVQTEAAEKGGTMLGQTAFVDNGSGNQAENGTGSMLEKGFTEDPKRLASAVMPSFVREKTNETEDSSSLSPFSAANSSTASSDSSSSRSSVSSSASATDGRAMSVASTLEETAEKAFEAARNTGRTSVDPMVRQASSFSSPGRTGQAVDEGAVVSQLFSAVGSSEEPVVSRASANGSTTLQAGGEGASKPSASILAQMPAQEPQPAASVGSGISLSEALSGWAVSLEEATAQGSIQLRNGNNQVDDLNRASFDVWKAEREIIFPSPASSTSELAAGDGGGSRQNQQPMGSDTQAGFASGYLSRSDKAASESGVASPSSSFHALVDGGLSAASSSSTAAALHDLRASSEEVSAQAKIGLRNGNGQGTGQAENSQGSWSVEKGSELPKEAAISMAAEASTGSNAPTEETIPQGMIQLLSEDGQQNSLMEDLSDAGHVEMNTDDGLPAESFGMQVASSDNGESRQEDRGSRSQEAFSLEDSLLVEDAAPQEEAFLSFDVLADDQGAESPVVSSSAPGAPASSASSSDSSSVRVYTADSSAAEDLAEQLMDLGRNKRNQLTLELDPQHLGKVILQVETRNDTVSAWLHTETEQARQWLLRNQSQLQQHLQDQGLSLGQFSVNVGDQGRGRHSGSHDSVFSQAQGLEKAGSVSSRTAAVSGSASRLLRTRTANEQRISLFA